MKKRILILFITACMLLCSCDVANNDAGQDDDAKDGVQSGEQDVTENDTGYEDIVCRETSDYDTRRFAFKESIYSLNLATPEDWSFTALSDSAYKIERDGKEIGQLCKGRKSSDEWKSVKSLEKGYDGISICYDIEKKR